MLIEIILALVMGICAGTFTGLAPGIHVNLIATLLLASLDSLSSIPPLALASFIVSMSITHTFLDFIPGVFLGAPNEDTFLAVLPAHQLFLEGRGFEAVILGLYGSLLALVITILILPAYLLISPLLYPLTAKIIPFLLLTLSGYVILREDKPLKPLAIFLLAGILGLMAFKLPVKDPLLPLLTGLFGLSNLFLSVKESPVIKKQFIFPLKKTLPLKKEFFAAFGGTIAATPFCSLLPGISSGHAAFIGSEIVKQTNKSFIILTGAANTLLMLLSFITIYSINKTRSGSAVAVNTLLQGLSLQSLTYLIIVALSAGIIAALIVVFTGKKFALIFNKINYSILSLGTIIFISALVLIFSNALGFFVLVASTALGILCIKAGVRRINLMSCLIIPVISYYIL